jgi:hypothetical protein
MVDIRIIWRIIPSTWSNLPDTTRVRYLETKSDIVIEQPQHKILTF